MFDNNNNNIIYFLFNYYVRLKFFTQHYTNLNNLIIYKIINNTN